MHLPLRVPLLVLLVALVLPACGPDAAEAPDGSGTASTATWPVLLLTVDTLRPDYLSSNGYDRPTSPFLDALFAEGTYFERATAPVPRTTPSLASLLTGAYPHTTGVRTLTDRLLDEQVSLAEVMQAAGYRTLAVVSNRVLSPEKGLGAGFEVYDAGHDVRSATPTSRTVWRRLGEKKSDAPLFLWVHYIDPHMPYHPDDAWAVRFDPEYRGPYFKRFGRTPRPGERADVFEDFPPGLPKSRVVHRNPLPESVNAHIRRLYAAEVRSLDDRLRDFVTALREQIPDLVIVFAADHGESLGEHDFYFDHGDYVYDAGSRVPLAFVLPASHPWHGSHRCGEWVSLVDVAPTLLEVLELEPPAEMAARFEGRSLAPCLRGEPLEPQPVFTESGQSFFPELVTRRVENSVAGRFRAVTAGDWKLIWTPFAPEDEAWELYDLAHDPHETTNLYAPDHPEVARLRPLLEEWMAREPQADAGPRPLSDADREALRALGYID